ncbi:hypothetical protein WA158_007042 [Blastocystis sp. Blastoise]
MFSLIVSRSSHTFKLQAIRAFAAAATPKYDVVVIGGGPGGYVSAIKAAQSGLKTACVESRGTLGGTCLNVGCIPSKSLLHSTEMYYSAKNEFKKHGIVVDKVDVDLKGVVRAKEKAVRGLTAGIEHLFKKNKVDYFKGYGTLTSQHDISVALNAGEKTQLQAENIILASGSVSRAVPVLPVDNQKFQIIDSTGALNPPKIPKTLTIVGGGVIGLELGTVYSRLGSKVEVVEFAKQIGGRSDSEMASTLMKSMQRQGITFRLNTAVKGSHVEGDKVILDVETDNNKSTIETETVLVCVGRVPFTKNLGLEQLGIDVDKAGRVKVDKDLRTKYNNIYAIGDIVDGPMLAHKAEEEGIKVVDTIKTGKGHVNYDLIPGVIYTSPEYASIGKTEEQLKADNIQYKKGSFPFQANSRARANDSSEGLVKILTDAKTDKILGVHILANGAGEMIHEACIAMEFGATAEDIARTCHAHPTLSEAVKEAALAAYDKPIHM